jgi:hypothetical protein
MTDAELLQALDRLKAIMIAVATGGPRISEAQAEFTQLYDDISSELASRQIKNPLPYRDLWEWYGHYSAGDMPKWQQRRVFVNNLFRDLVRGIQEGHARREPPDLPRQPEMAARSDAMQWDVFVSHASEDKDDFARPLAQRLQASGLRVWFDAFTLTVGDSLRQSIDRGLARSRYGVVVISPDFLKKQWPQIELDGMIAREVAGVKVILPVWHKLGIDEVRASSPILAGRLAVSSETGIEHVAQELLRAIRREEQTEESPLTDVESATNAIQ